MYYGILSLLRLLLARFISKLGIGKHLRQEWKRARVCAWILLTINLFLSAAVLLIRRANRELKTEMNISET